MTDPIEEELPGHLSQEHLMRLIKANRGGREALRLVLREIWIRNKQKAKEQDGEK